jgi:hypothetical protein
MRNVINTAANVTTNAIVNRTVRTVLAGVDAMRASSAHHLRLYTSAAQAASAPQGWFAADGPQPFAGKQKPAGTGTSPGRSELSRCSRRLDTRCRRPRVSSCLARS